jgi:DMSO/TMAO reductase YedYZ molybdopterin-dependent catalytic subunit
MTRRSLATGAAASAASLAVLWAVSRAAPAIQFPPSSLADRVVRLTPGWLATAAIDRLQHGALPLLVAVVTVVLGVAGALAVLAAGPGRPGALRAGALVAALDGGAGAVAPVAPSAAAIVLAAVAGGGVYALVLDALRAGRAPGGRAAHDPARREALRRLALGLLGIGLGAGGLGRLLGSASSPSAASLAAARRLDRSAAGALPRLAGLAAPVTPVADHYVVDIDINDPLVDVGQWRLAVRGLVDRPLRLGFDELQRRFALVEEVSVLTCISNRVGGPLVGNSAWTGVRLRDVLRAAGVRPGAVDVAFRCADGYSVGVPLAAALDPSALVAVGQDGRALEREHGFPCRVRLPALYGMMNAKWIEAIEVVDRRFLGYWQQQGWAYAARVRTESRIDRPRQARAGAPVWIAGVAWAGTRGVSAVEVSLDRGRTWRRAQVEPALSPLAWRRWGYRWTPARRGRHRVTCRATDGDGRVQDPSVRPPHPSGASGYHTVDVTVT